MLWLRDIPVFSFGPKPLIHVWLYQPTVAWCVTICRWVHYKASGDDEFRNGRHSRIYFYLAL
jgi:hypothetical protein